MLGVWVRASRNPILAKYHLGPGYFTRLYTNFGVSLQMKGLAASAPCRAAPCQILVISGRRGCVLKLPKGYDTAKETRRPLALLLLLLPLPPPSSSSTASTVPVAANARTAASQREMDRRDFEVPGMFVQRSLSRLLGCFVFWPLLVAATAAA